MPLDLRFTAAVGGAGRPPAQLLLVSNNPYQLARTCGAAARGPRLDSGRARRRLGAGARRRRRREARRARGRRPGRRFSGLERVDRDRVRGRLRLARSRSASTARPSAGAAAALRDPAGGPHRAAAAALLSTGSPRRPCAVRDRPRAGHAGRRCGAPLSDDRRRPADDATGRRSSRASRSRSGSPERLERRARPGAGPPERRGPAATGSGTATASPTWPWPGCRRPALDAAAEPAVALRQPLQAVVPHRRRCSPPFGGPQRPPRRR